jgi:hypothetical protein
VRKVDRGFLWLNLLFLLFITFLPFSTNLVGGFHDLHIPVVVYGINVLLLSLILLVSLRYLTQRPSGTADELISAVRPVESYQGMTRFGKRPVRKFRNACFFVIFRRGQSCDPLCRLQSERQSPLVDWS